MQDGAETYLSPAELSARWNGKVKVKTLSNWRVNGEGPEFQRFGRTVAYPLSAIESYERKRRFTKASQKVETQ